MKFKYNGTCANFGDVFGYQLDEKGVVDIPNDNQMVIKRLTSNRYFDKHTASRKSVKDTQITDKTKETEPKAE